MKVIEGSTDRMAFAYITVEGQVNPLDEYGQYIDARDKALCCYIAVEEGHKLRVKGSFSGPTLIVAYDCTVDGVCRKANSYAGKTVQVQKNKKLDVDSFLYQTSDGVIDTEMTVSPFTGTANLNKEAAETVGTIELRVYITRQFDVEHEIEDACKYDEIKEHSHPSTQVANYKDVPLQYQMTFEKNCSTLDGRKGKQEKRKVYAKRPGKEPWAIFRFHYRTKESIEASKMNVSFDAANTAPAKQEAHPLELESVPPLILGSKPAGKNDGESSVRTSSPPPSDTPLTPTKGPKKSQSAQPKVMIRKQQTKLESLTTNSTSKMASITNNGSAIDAEGPVAPRNPLNHVHSTHSKTKDDAAVANITDDSVPTGKKDDSDTAAASTPTKVMKKVAKKATEATDTNFEKCSKESVDEVVKKVEPEKDSDMVDAMQPSLSVEVYNAPTVPHPADISSVFDTPIPSSTPAALVTVAPSTKDFVKSGNKGFTSPFKKAVTKPASIDTATSTLLQKAVISPVPALPLKRASEGTLTPPPDLKRIKTDEVPPLTPTQLLRSLTTSQSPRSQSIEAQVAEQRKHLEAARKKRKEMAKKKAALDERMAPYKQRMAEELVRLQQDTADEEAQMAADEEEYMTSKAMLVEFEGDGGEV